jgi:hypothetical protein
VGLRDDVEEGTAEMELSEVFKSITKTRTE